jgi:hypothetical protein
MQNNGTAVSIVQPAAPPEKPPRLCIQCWEPIADGEPGYRIGAVNLVQMGERPDWVWVANYHEECAPKSVRNECEFGRAYRECLPLAA